LISFNNKPAKEAIPSFEELIVPLSTLLMNEESEQTSRLREDIRNLRSLFDTSVDSIASAAIVPAFVEKELIPVLRQGLQIVDQIPGVLRMISDGYREVNCKSVKKNIMFMTIYSLHHRLVTQKKCVGECTELARHFS